MSGETLYQRPRRHNVAKIRVHDYLYDSAFIVSGAKDYARTAFRAAMASAQVMLQPVYKTMFSEMRRYPSVHAVYHMNCRLPDHIDRSYGAYLQRASDARHVRPPQLSGRDRYRFTAMPKKLLDMRTISPDFRPPTSHYVPPTTPRPRNRATQSLFRESSAQTIPWQPDGKAAEDCENTPEVLFLDKLEWGPGCPFRVGDLPADFHTTEIINKLRHARCWMELIEKGQYPRWMKKTDAIITDIETKDWIFREAEIDELQNIRLELLHQMQHKLRNKQTNRTSRKLAKLWTVKKETMEKKIDHIRKTRDRELRKLTALHSGGGRVGLVQRMRASRGAGSMTSAAHDPTSDLIAPLSRHGYQARRRHADIEYDPTLLSYEDHKKLAEPPEWLERCGQDLKHTCSGHHLPKDTMQLCERETKWSEQFLESLHNELKMARLGAASASAGPLRVLKPRRLAETPRPATPEVDRIDDEEEASHQSAILLQKIIRGRAVQNLMYEGRTRASELTEELKTTHGLQKEDRQRIAREEAKAREYTALRNEAEQTDAALTALVDELCGGAVSAALDFLEKELRRLREERRQHAFILIAIREKQMREAAEAGRRQKEEHRRREHDEMFKQILGVTQETVDAYFREILFEGVHLAAEEDAVDTIQRTAAKMDESLAEHDSMSTAEQNDLVAGLVQQFLLPEAHKTALRMHVSDMQKAKLEAARKAIFGVLDDAEEQKEPKCIRCGVYLGDKCRCHVCPEVQEPVETTARDDPRWKYTRVRPKPPEKSWEERFPPEHEMRCMLNEMINDVVTESRSHRAEIDAITRDIGRRLRERTEAKLDAKSMVDYMVDLVTGGVFPPLKDHDYHHFMMRIYDDALERSVPFHSEKCPKQLPSELRREAERLSPPDITCLCDEEQKPETKKTAKIKLQIEEEKEQEEQPPLLPSDLRALEELRRCKCDSSPTFTGAETAPTTTTEFASTTDEGDPEGTEADPRDDKDL